jgi:2-haloacid dehalogenase
MQLPHTPQWITFDCYGTLIDTRAGYVPLFRKLIEEKGAGARLDTLEAVNWWGEEEFRLIQGPYKKYRSILKESVENTLGHFGSPVASGDGERLADAWGTFKPYADVHPVLSRLKKSFKLALISNVDDDMVAQSVASIGIDFDGVFTAEKSGASSRARSHSATRWIRWGSRLEMFCMWLLAGVMTCRRHTRWVS